MNPTCKSISHVELLCVLAIFSLLLAHSIPNYHHHFQKKRALQALEQLAATLHHAQQWAILKQERIYVCPSLDQEHCGGSWEKGYVVRSHTQVLLQHPTPFPFPIGFHAFAGQDNQITFLPSGRTHNNGHFEYHAPSTKDLSSNFKLLINKNAHTHIVSGD